MDLDLWLLSLDEEPVKVSAAEEGLVNDDSIYNKGSEDLESNALDESEIASENDIDLDIDYTELDLSDLGDGVVESESNAGSDSVDLETVDSSIDVPDSAEEDIFSLDLDEGEKELSLEATLALAESAAEFDLDLPPADLDMASLDKELDEMTAVLDDVTETETETEFNIEDGLDEAMESMTAHDDVLEEPEALVESEFVAPVSEEDDTDFETDEDEVGTKLDLAQAYIDMGDMDGAEDILQEVMEEGSEEQKATAEKFLQGL
jgi:pilus assembly protein FimV